MKQQNAASRERALPSVSRPLQFLAVAVLVVIAAAAAQHLMSLRSSVLDGAEMQLARLDMVLAEQTSRAVEMVDFLTRTAIETLHVAPAPPARSKFEDLLRRRMAGVPQISGLTIADLNGKVEYTTNPDAPPILNKEGMAALAWHMARPGPGLHISPPFRDTDGQWTALLTRPCHGADGNLIGIAAANLSLSYFEDFYRAVDLGQNGAIILQIRDGTILARYPHVDTAIGVSMADLPPFTDVLAHSEAGTLIMTAPYDGSVRVAAIRALRTYPLAVMVSLDEGRLLADWRRQAWSLALATALTGIVIVGLLLLLAARSRQVERVLIQAQAARTDAEYANRQLKDEMNERERAESALRQAQRIEAIGQLTGGVAHDFNNLLTVVLGNVDLLLDGRNGVPPEAAVAERLNAVRVAAARGATLTSHLLAFARRQPLMPRATDVNAIISGMRNLLDSAVGRARAVEVRLADGLWPAMIDPAQFELVILNLVINARDAMERSGVVTIKTANAYRGRRDRPDDPPVGEYVLVSVTDTGTGMTPEVKARAFEPFFTTKAQGAGSGLGLSQVFGTARQLGGGVHIDSEPGRGTVVSVFVPRAIEPAAIFGGRPSPVSERPHQGSDATILLVDDDEPVRATVAATLRGMGYQLREANNAADALEMLRQDTGIDVLLTDLVMPGSSGAHLADAAQDVRPDLTVVYISGYAEAMDAVSGSRLRRLVRKPFVPADLRNQIEASLRERATETL